MRATHSSHRGDCLMRAESKNEAIHATNAPFERSSIVKRTTCALLAVFVLLFASWFVAGATLRHFERLDHQVEVIDRQATRLAASTLFVYRSIQSDPIASDLEQSLGDFEACLSSLKSGGEVVFGNSKIVCTPLVEPEAIALIDRIESEWRAHRESIASCRIAVATRADSSSAVLRAVVPLLSASNALGTAVSGDSDLEEVVGELRSLVTRIQVTASQITTIQSGDARSQADLAVTLAADQSTELLKALRDGDEDREIEPVTQDSAKAAVLRMVDALAPVTESVRLLVEASRTIEQKLAEITARSTSLESAQADLLTVIHADKAAAMARFDRVQLFLNLLIILALLVLGAYLRRAVFRPLLLLRDVVANIARGDGDLTVRLDASRSDEIGELAERFNEFLSKLRALVSSLAQAIDRLSTSSQAMRTVANDMIATVAATDDRSQQLLTGVEAMNREFDAVVSESTGLEQRSGEIQGGCDAAFQEVEHSIELSSEVQRDIDALRDSARKIDSVLRAIETISSKTRFLSLNATIEASRAGAAGRGFAVVANEVKELAERTAAETAQIDSTLGELIQVCDRSHRSFGEVDQAIRRIRERQDAARGIAMEQVKGSLSMRSALTRSNENNDAIRQNAEALKQHAGSAASAANTTRSAAQELDGVASELATLVHRFKY